MFEMIYPWFLALFPLPFLLRYLMPRNTKQQTTALKVPFFAQLKAMQAQSSFRNKGKSLALVLLTFIWGLALFGLSDPQWVGKPIEIPQQGRDILLALDLSGSMRAEDMVLNGRQVTRLAVVKKAADQFIEQRKGDRIGLILFGSRAYLQTPLTFDRKTVVDMLNDATIGLAGIETAVGDAIGLAIKRLRRYPKESRVLILLTDGSSNAGSVKPIPAAKLAAQEDIKIYTIGLGAERMVVPSIFGNQVVNPSADLDEATLKKVAKITGGLYFRARNTKELEKIYASLDELEPVSEDTLIFRPRKPLYPWPLGLLLLLSVWYLWRYQIKTCGVVA